jgi:hypothetical protein
MAPSRCFYSGPGWSGTRKLGRSFGAAPGRSRTVYLQGCGERICKIGAVKRGYRTLARYGERNRDPERLNPRPEPRL